MTEIALIASSAGTITLVGVVVWLVGKALGDRDREADARVAQTATEGLLERSQFELETTKASLDAARKRADALEEAMADAINIPTNADLAPDDVHGRVLRVLQRWRAAEAGGGPVPAQPGNSVPAKETAGAPDTPAVPGK